MRSPQDMVAAWHKAEEAVDDIGDARRSAEHAVEDVLDALRGLRHRDDRFWRLGRDTRKPSRRTGGGLYEAASVSRDVVTTERVAVFASGVVTGLIAGWWISRALATVELRESAARLLTPVAEKSRKVTERPRAALESVAERPVAVVRSVVGKSDDATEAQPGAGSHEAPGGGGGAVL